MSGSRWNTPPPEWLPLTSPADGVRLMARRFPARRGPARPPVILLHGTAQSQAMWRGLGWVDALRDGADVWTVDLRGHGRSDRPHDPAAYAMDRFVADALTVADATGAPAASIIGFSLGGRVAFSAVTAHPERFTTMVSLAGSPVNRAGAFDRVFFPGIARSLAAGDMDATLHEWERRRGRPIPPADRAVLAANDPRALAAYMVAEDADLGVPFHALTGLHLPVLLLVGDRDAERERAAQLSAAYIPRARLRIIPGAGHGGLLRSTEARRASTCFLAEPRPARGLAHG
jgi:pimeloyl-ACP methyl ester carboxylesterase